MTLPRPVDAPACPICRGATAAGGSTVNGFELRRCAACGHRFAPAGFSQVPDYDEVWATEEYAGKRAAAAPDEDPGALVRHPTYAPFFRRVSSGPGRALLDVGSGAGQFCRAATAVGFAAQGLDPSSRAVGEAAGRGCAVTRGGICDVARTGAAFDVVTAFEVLEHVPDPVDFLRTAKGVLRPGGELFCTVPNGESAEVMAGAGRDVLPPVHLHFFSRAALRAAGERAGLERVRVGIVWTDFFPGGAAAGARWVARRLLGRRNAPLGLWLHARAGS